MTKKLKSGDSFARAIALALGLLLVYLAIINLSRFISSFSYKPTKSLAVVEVAQAVLAKPDSRVMIMFLNNAEARIGGGFVGTVGAVQRKGQKLELESIKTVYYYDALAKKRFDSDMSNGILPPIKEPFIRDSNYSLNWSDNADRASQVFAYATEKQVDGVIALTPDVIIELLRVTGPIYLSKYNKTISAENFRIEVQLESEAGQDKLNNRDPHAILPELANELLSHLQNKNLNELPELVPLLQELAEKKHLVFWSRDDTVQSKIQQDNLGGGISRRVADYIQVNEANTAANKSTQAINQKISKQVMILPDGNERVRLTLDRKHTSDYSHRYFDPWGNYYAWVIAENDAEMKLAIPTGSKVVSHSESAKEFSVERDGSQQFVRFFSRLKPLSQESYEIVYELPFKHDLSRELTYTESIQKQVGGFPFDYQLSLIVPPGYQLSAASQPKLFEGPSLIVLKQRLEKDQINSFVFTNRDR